LNEIYLVQTFYKHIYYIIISRRIKIFEIEKYKNYTEEVNDKNILHNLYY